MIFIQKISKKVNWLVQEIAKLKKVSDEVFHKSLEDNYCRIYYVSIVATVLFLMLTVYFDYFIKAETAIELLWKKGIHTTHMILFVLFLIIFLFTRFTKDIVNSNISMKLIQNLTIGTLMAGSIVITSFEQLVSEDIMPFVMFSMVVSSVFLIRPLHALAIYSISYIGFLYGHYLTAEFTANISNGLSITFIGFLISFINWRNYVTTIMQDSLIREQQAELEQMAFFDTLTNLPNRRLFDELVKKEMDIINSNKIQSCIIIADLDHFKKVNDTYGHPVGDCVLQQFAKLIKDNLRASDIVARLGGEEFIILLPSTNKENAAIVSENLKSVVESTAFKCGENTISITSSFGVSELSCNPTHSNYYQNADNALYMAKQDGRNKVIAL
ncbi:MAG: GGDEF domain-containing protein [Sedimentibacter sp.]